MDKGKAAARLIIWVTGAYLACAILVALTTLLTGHPEWWRALVVAAGIAAMAAIMSASALLIGLNASARNRHTADLHSCRLHRRDLPGPYRLSPDALVHRGVLFCDPDQ